MTTARLTLDQMNEMAVKALVIYFNKRNSGNAAVASINIWKASKAKLIEKIAAGLYGHGNRPMAIVTGLSPTD